MKEEQMGISREEEEIEFWCTSVTEQDMRGNNIGPITKNISLALIFVRVCMYIFRS
jgi:hypothetical protein